MTFSIVIPARYQSQRLPGKPLLDLGGKSMLQRTYEQVQGLAAQAIIIATDDQRIAEAAHAFGANVALTSTHHHSGTDRIAEVVAQQGWPDDTIVVNVQGDEPFIPPQIVEQVARNLHDNDDCAVATLVAPLECPEHLHDPNVVKVVFNHNHRALYFSRAPIPWRRDKHNHPNAVAGACYYRHIGLYAYRAHAVRAFSQWPQAPIEQLEMLEQLRFLWYGTAIHVDQACVIPPPGIDTTEDLQQARLKNFPRR